MKPSDVDADVVSGGRFCGGGAVASWRRAVVLVAGMSLLASCGMVELSGPALTRIDKALEARKGPSVKAWERGGPDRRDRLKLAELQTGLLLRWDDMLDIVAADRAGL
ncbi:hypothetical protein, partial [Haloferula sp. BvORR071]|uniref:hypothetical protein n=1 Tax=Haloferula sp. BvORR071 TaxID=1396141 RepID=UPI000551C35F